MVYVVASVVKTVVAVVYVVASVVVYGIIRPVSGHFFRERSLFFGPVSMRSSGTSCTPLCTPLFRPLFRHAVTVFRSGRAIAVFHTSVLSIRCTVLRAMVFTLLT